MERSEEFEVSMVLSEELDDIDLVDVEHKIFSQYHDNSGDLIEPNVE